MADWMLLGGWGGATLWGFLIMVILGLFFATIESISDWRGKRRKH